MDGESFKLWLESISNIQLCLILRSLTCWRYLSFNIASSYSCIKCTSSQKTSLFINLWWNCFHYKRLIYRENDSRAIRSIKTVIKSWRWECYWLGGCYWSWTSFKNNNFIFKIFYGNKTWRSSCKIRRCSKIYSSWNKNFIIKNEKCWYRYSKSLWWHLFKITLICNTSFHNIFVNNFTKFNYFLSKKRLNVTESILFCYFYSCFLYFSLTSK